ncbi:tetratricopeptide repeat protein [Metabacillus malikii]|uniref:Tetratricopeptide (TPR) repeat protein n=1 Tax=Metabacillus malikii TaxID=1504265 RepID=A0ABT9ZA00_9BACI|nr:tetratricopeptide repeat protein [Metabacillus malikii]MDQ0229067.1 tetratricopeptide (TPR) repeat protein [Metabacillus malikii]
MNTVEERIVDFIAAKQYDAGIQYVKGVLKEHPTDGDSYAWLAAIYGLVIEEVNFSEKLNYVEQLEENILKALKYSPNSKLVRKVNGIRLIKTPNEYGGDSQEGIELLEGLLAEGESEYDLYYHLAVAYTELNQFVKAKEYLANAIQLDPNGPEVNKLKEYIGIVEHEDY